MGKYIMFTQVARMAMHGCSIWIIMTFTVCIMFIEKLSYVLVRSVCYRQLAIHARFTLSRAIKAILYIEHFTIPYQ